MSVDNAEEKTATYYYKCTEIICKNFENQSSFWLKLVTTIYIFFIKNG